jgi:polyhydroxyalkanoate synthase
MSAATEAAADYWRAVEALANAAEAETLIGATQADHAYSHGKLRLFRYRRETAGAPPPILIVHGLVGRASVTDLAPNRSLVRDLLAGGADVWTIDWGAPSRADRFETFADLVLDKVGACAAHVRAETGRAPILLGICEGGLFALCLAALRPEAVAGVVPVVTPLDFHADPDALLTRWVRAFAPEDLARLVDVFGYLPGGALGAIFQALDPARTMRKYTTDLLDLCARPDALRQFLRMERWLADRPHHPGEAAKTLLIDLYHANRLAAGTLSLDGEPVRLAAIRAPVLAVYGLRDHIVPPACAAALGPLLGPETRYDALPLDAGHIGVFVSRRAEGLLAAGLLGWLEALRT